MTLYGMATHDFEIFTASERLQYRASVGIKTGTKGLWP